MNDQTDANTHDGLSVIIPCYNEENGVTDTLESLLTILGTMDTPFEVLAVDDGSKDKTLQRLEAFGDRIRIIQNPTNRGYGASLKHGLLKSTFNLIAIIDADGTYRPEYLPGLFTTLKQNDLDMTVGARTGARVAVPLVRKPAKWVLGKLANFVAGQKIPDINSGLRVFKRTVAMDMFPLFPDGFSFTTTITLAMLTNGYDVHYTPIDYLHRIGRSKIRPIRDTLNFVQLILRISLYFAPLKLFIPLSLSLFLMSIALGLVSHYVFGQFADVSTLVLFVTGLQLGVLGMLAELMNIRLPRLHKKHD